MIRFVRDAILLLAGLALAVAWTAVDLDGLERPRVPAIELPPREQDRGQRPGRTDAGRSERRGASTDPGEGAATAPALQPAPADDDAEDLDDEADDAEDGDDGDDGDN
jgi:hypothetical protein